MNFGECLVAHAAYAPYALGFLGGIVASMIAAAGMMVLNHRWNGSA